MIIFLYNGLKNPIIISITPMCSPILISAVHTLFIVYDYFNIEDGFIKLFGPL